MAVPPLYFIYQRYNFESKSQHISYTYHQFFSCISYTKGTILKANHNQRWLEHNAIGLYFIYQRYNFESKSQLYYWPKFANLGCISYTKGTILKANHNREQGTNKKLKCKTTLRLTLTF